MAINTSGSNRDQLDFGELSRDERDRAIERLFQQEVLVGDPRRWRPRWFDGRFLAASDLQAEQNYFLVRQTDLGRASGSGVVDGLMVTQVEQTGQNVSQLRIDAGYGVTDTGELITLFDPLTINPADVPEMRRIDAAFGLQLIPNESGANRTGLYLLALRAVEWTANPIGAYPTSLTGPRTVEDGTIVEGVAVSLVPYPDTGNEETWERRRARVAREIFVHGRDRGLNSGILPLAMVALQGNLVRWVDPFMIRRETGAERPAGMDFGFGARALREAHLLQYRQHLADALDAHRDQPFAANNYFDALPPVGQFPSGSIDPTRLTQRFFPAGIEVDLSFVPEDELPALIEESLLLPPLDLTRSVEDLRGTGMVVLVPLSRGDFAANRSSLPNWDDQPPSLRPGFVQLKASATPRELLLSHLFRPVARPEPTTEEEPWRQLLRDALANPLLWYVRRRHLPIPTNIAGSAVSATSEAVAAPNRLVDVIRSDAIISERFGALSRSRISEAGLLASRLSSANIVDNPNMVRSLVTAATSGEEGAPTPESVTNALARATDRDLGTGIERVSDVNSDLGRRLTHVRVADSGRLSDIDVLARRVPEDQVEEFSNELLRVLGTSGSAPADLEGQLNELNDRFVPRR